MKVAYIAPYKDGTGYAKAAIENMLALDCVGVEVVPRAVKMTPSNGEIPCRIIELEQNNLLNIDAVVQHNLPTEFSYKSGVKNIGGFYYETNGFPNTNWSYHLKLMDGIFVSSQHQKQVVTKECGKIIGDRTYVITPAACSEKFTRTYELMDFGLANNTVKFYTISELTRRKNIPALLAAYLSTFSSDDNVVLIVKAHDPSRNVVNGRKILHGIIEDLKQSLNRFSDPARYPAIVLLNDYMTDSQINSLHKTADIFVSASHGEAWCLPAIDALGFGNYVLAPRHGAFIDYIGDRTHLGYLVDGSETTVLGVQNAPPGLYSSDEQWFNINIHSLSQCLKQSYEVINQINHPEEKAKRFEYIRDKYSYNKVGQEFKQMIENLNAN